MVDLEITIPNPFASFRRKYGLWGILLMVLSIISIVLGIIIVVYFFYQLSGQYDLVERGKEIDMNSTGSTGDFIGGIVGTIWSLAGVLLFFLALRLQSKELSLQIQELRDTKKVFISQQFESTFFNLLKVQQEIRKNLLENFKNMDEEIEEGENQYELDFFEVLESELIEAYDQVMRIFNQPDKPENEIIEEIQGLMESKEIDSLEYLDTEEKRARVAYYIVFRDYHNQLGHYFRHLYHILDFVAEKESFESRSEAWNRMKSNYEKALVKIDGEFSVDEEIKSRYKKFINLIQAQMSSSELLLLFYNGICFPKMKKLILTYEFLENLSEDDLMTQSHKDFYSDQMIDQRNFKEINFKNKTNILKQNLN